MESRHSVQSTSVSYGGIGEIQKDVPNSRHIFYDVFYFYLIKLNALHISSYQIMLFLDIFIAYLLCIFRASVKIGDKIHVFCQKKMFQPKIPSIFV